MIFRDLIQPEEFVIGQPLYSTRSNDTTILQETVISNYPYSVDLRTYTKYGLEYSVNDFNTVEDFCKTIITNNINRILPIKYKLL